MGATGFAHAHLPPGAERDDVLYKLRIAEKICAQHVGRRLGFFAQYLLRLARKIDGPLRFDAVLLEMGLEGQRRAVFGAAASPIERVDKTFELVTYHDPKRGRLQMPFGTVRNHLTDVKKILGR